MKTWRMNNRGVALVEFVLIALLLLTLAIGIIDFGLLAKDYLTLGSGAREGAREAAMGGNLVSVTDKVRTSAPTPKAGESPVQVSLWYRERAEGSGWTEWGPPENISTGATDVEVKVKAVYTCNRISGTFVGANPISLSTEEVMRRE